VSASEAVPRARGWAAGVARPGVDLWLWRERERAAEEADVVRSAEHLERELRAGAARGSEKSPLDDMSAVGERGGDWPGWDNAKEGWKPLVLRDGLGVGFVLLWRDGQLVLGHGQAFFTLIRRSRCVGEHQT